jgi:hypothetical protein
VPSDIGIRDELEFTDYRNMRDVFESSELWEKEMIDDPIIFWNFTEAYAPTFFTFAKRLFECPTSSISYERAFSIINLIYTKFRNRLTIERVDKLCYIHIDRKIPDRSKID